MAAVVAAALLVVANTIRLAVYARRDEIGDAYAHLARLCASQPRNIAITASATAAFVQAVSTIHFEPGDSIITSRLDYTSYQIQFIALSQRLGVRVIHAPELPGGG